MVFIRKPYCNNVNIAHAKFAANFFSHMFTKNVVRKKRRKKKRKEKHILVMGFSDIFQIELRDEYVK